MSICVRTPCPKSTQNVGRVRRKPFCVDLRENGVRQIDTERDSAPFPTPSHRVTAHAYTFPAWNLTSRTTSLLNRKSRAPSLNEIVSPLLTRARTPVQAMRWAHK